MTPKQSVPWVLLLVAGCVARPETPAGAAPRVAPATDLTGLLQRTRLGFHETPTRGLSARGAHHQLEALESGRLRFAVVDDWTVGPAATLTLTPGSRQGGFPRSSGLHVEQSLSDCTQEVLNSEAGAEVRWRLRSRPTGTGAWTMTVAVDGFAFERASEGAVLLRAAEGSARVAVGAGTWVDGRGRRTLVPTRWEGSALRWVVSADLLASSEFPAVLDPTLTPLRDVDAVSWVSGGGASLLSASFDGTTHLVAFRPWLSQTFVAARVSGQGVLLDPTPLPLGSATFGANMALASASAPGVHGVAQIRGGVVELVRVDAAGVTLGTTTLQFAAATTQQVGVGFTNGVYLVAWKEVVSPTSARWLAARVSSTGTQLDTAPLVVAPAEGELSVTALNGTFLVVFGSPGGAIKAARVSSGGALLDATPLQLGNGVQVAAAASGTEFLTAWLDGMQVRAALITPGGTLLNPGGVLVSGQLQTGADYLATLAAVAEPTQFRLAWSDRLSLATHVNTRRVAFDGGLLDPTSTVLSGDEVTALTASATPSDTLVSWATTGEVKGLVVLADGGLLSSTPSLFSVRKNGEVEPLVAASRDVFLAVWNDDRGGVYGSRITLDGGVLDDPGFQIAPVRRARAVASNGDDFLVAIPEPTGFLVVRVSAGGAPVAGSLRHYAAGPGRDPALSAFAGDYLIAWIEAGQLRLARALGDGGHPDPAVGVAAGSALAGVPTIAATDAGFVVGWSAGPQLDAMAMRVGADLVLPDAGAVAIIPGCNCGFQLVSAQGGLLLAGDISSRVVANDLSGVGPSVSGTSRPMVFDGKYFLTADFLKVRRYDVGLASVGSTPLNPTQCTTPTVSLATEGVTQRSAVMSECFTPAVTRVQFQVIDTRAAGLGNPCSGAADCLSGFCVDGVCCDSLCGGADAGPDCIACSQSAGAMLNGVCGPSVSPLPCRPAAGPCDRAEYCNGSSVSCPADGVLDAGAGCFPATQCRLASFCDGLGPACNYSSLFPPGTACDDGLFCSINDACNSGGQCKGDDRICPFTTADCRVPICSATLNACVSGQQHLPDGTACDGGLCQAGACLPVDAGSGVDAGFDAGTPDAGAPDGGADGGGDDAGATGGGAGGSGGAGGGGGSGEGGAGGGGGGNAGVGGGNIFGPLDGGNGLTPPPTPVCGCSSGGDFARAGLFAVLALVRRRRRVSGNEH